MHELRIAENIVSSVEREMQRRGVGRLKAIGLQIGTLTDIVPESLEFGFNILIADTQLAGAILNIERVSVTGRCRECGREFEVEDMSFRCPACDGRSIETIRGQELDICYLEIEESDTDEGKTTATWPG